MHQQLSITEADGSLVFSFSTPDRDQTLVFDGHHTVLDLDKTRQGQYWDGNGYQYLPIPVYLPFNFHCLQIYSPSSVSSDGSALANTKMLYGSQGRREVFGDGTIAFEPAEPGNISKITFGEVRRPLDIFSYSNYRTFGTVALPSSIGLSVYREFKSRSGPLDYRQILQATFTLLSADLDSVPAKSLTLANFIKKDYMYSYNGTMGSAGVLFDPALGSFEDQAKAAVDLRKNYPNPSTRQPTKEGLRVGTIPFILSTVFGVAAVVALILGLLKRRSAQV